MKTTTGKFLLPWNLVTKHLHGHDLLRKKIHQKINKLSRHLAHFPEGTVHLHIALERNPHREFYTARLTLRLPSNILHAEKAGPDLIRAFDDAVKALLRELTALKARFRRESWWKNKTRRAALRARKAAGFAPQPQPEGEGPQHIGDVIRELLGAQHSRLLRYVRRFLWHAVTAGEIPANAIDPRAVVDEVARRALAAPQKKPENMSFQLWFYALARQELARRCKALRSRSTEVVRLETPEVLPDEAELAEGYDAEQPLDIIERRLQPPVAEAKDKIPDARIPTPEQEVLRQDLLAEARRTASTWPAFERELFELYFVEGFEPEDIAMITGRTKEQVRAGLQNVQERLRASLLEQAAV